MKRVVICLFFAYTIILIQGNVQHYVRLIEVKFGGVIWKTSRQAFNLCWYFVLHLFLLGGFGLMAERLGYLSW